VKPYTVHTGDCRDVLRDYPADHFDSIVSDPPYGLTFMGKGWDRGVPGVEFWQEALRVAKPGAHLLAFGGTRTFHRLTVAIEDAGWQVRDCISWLYATGFPKSHNGPWGGTALKPAWEPVIVARKPLSGTVADNVLRYGTGALNIDGCRVGWATPTEAAEVDARSGPNSRHDASSAHGAGSIFKIGGQTAIHTAGRWPANVMHDGSAEVVAGFPADEGRFFQCCNDSACLQREGGYNATDPKPEHLCHEPHPPRSSAATAAPSSSLRNVAESTVRSFAATWGSHAVTVSSDTMAPSTNVTPTECASIVEACTVTMLSIASGCLPELRHERRTLSGSLASAAATRSQTGIMTITASLLRSDGSAEHVTFNITPDCLALGEAASRFRYCAKASRTDREEGCDHLPARSGADAVERDEGTAGLQSPRAGAGRTADTVRNFHPTVKPTDLMRYLCRLVTPPAGLVLDPFCGSGSTGKAALLEGLRFVGVDLDPAHVAIAEARCQFAVDTVAEQAAAAEAPGAQLALF
jgi:DNA modification methylase